MCGKTARAVTARWYKEGWTAACGRRARSEEHTSELQSRPHLVCRLLLEKKNVDRRLLRRADAEPDVALVAGQELADGRHVGKHLRARVGSDRKPTQLALADMADHGGHGL